MTADAKVTAHLEKLKGVQRLNPDDMSRQELLPLCKQYELLELREVDDTPDPNAMAVYRDSGEHLGYLPSQTAADLRKRGEANYKCRCYFVKMVGGTPDKPIRGGRVLIFLGEPDSTEEDFNRCWLENLSRFT